MLDLDDKYAAGKIAPSTYKTQKYKLTKQIKDIQAQAGTPQPTQPLMGQKQAAAVSSKPVPVGDTVGKKIKSVLPKDMKDFTPDHAKVIGEVIFEDVKANMPIPVTHSSYSAMLHVRTKEAVTKQLKVLGKYHDMSHKPHPSSSIDSFYGNMFTHASKNMPKGWKPHASIPNVGPKIHEGSQNAYHLGSNTITFDTASVTQATVVHETAHFHVMNNPSLRALEKSYWEQRTGNSQWQSLGAGYGANELTKPDNFVHPYMGKVTVAKGAHGQTYEVYELLSTGAEAYWGPTGKIPGTDVHITEDDDFYNFFVGSLFV
jgi:hypothetical protein